MSSLEKLSGRIYVSVYITVQYLDIYLKLIMYNIINQIITYYYNLKMSIFINSCTPMTYICLK